MFLLLLLPVSSFKSVSQAISGLLWGLLADRTSRVRLLALGCAGWGVVAVLLASATKFWQFCLLKALNGVAMARYVANYSGIGSLKP